MTDLTDILPKVLALMEVSKQQPAQRDPLWLLKRNGFITASEAASTLALTQHEIDLRDQGIIDLPPEKKVGQVIPAYNTYAELMRKKCAPASSEGSPGSVEMEWGVAYEHIVTELHQAFSGTDIHAFNLIPHPTIPFLAASPDGVSSDGRMVEIKCPYSRMPSGKPKIQYWIQMQLQMECCDMEVCDFLDIVIREYGNREAYLNDKYGVTEDHAEHADHADQEEFIYSRTATGRPKGIMIERNIQDVQTGKIHRKYYYPPVLHFENEQQENAWLEEWAQTVYQEIGQSTKRILDVLTNQIETYQIRYWYVEQWNCVPVARDREWFKLRYPDLKAFWDQVTYYRANGLPDKIERSGSLPSLSRAPSRADSICSQSKMTSFVTGRKEKIVPIDGDGCLFLDTADDD
jgi:putative phage-type endonuclease